MDKHYTYLLLNIFTLLFPVLLSFDKRVQFFKSWRYIFPGLVITGSIFLFWDYLFTLFNVWSFNPEYVIGVYILNLPIEEILFFITVPFACLFIYECLNCYVKKDLLERWSNVISCLFVILSLYMLIRFYQQVYTLITFSLLLALSSFVLIKKPVSLSRFYFAYFVSLIPFYLINGLLTSIPVVMYNDLENAGLRVGSIPFEDHFYSLAMLMMNFLFFEYFRRKRITA